MLAIAATFGVAAGCGGDDDDDTAATEATTTEEAAGGGGGATEVSMTEYAFKPKHLTVSKGDTIIAKNDGQIPHNYSIKLGQEEVQSATAEGKVKIGASSGDVDPGSSTGSFPVDVSRGTYDVICTIPGHAEKGMKGTLTVK